MFVRADCFMLTNYQMVPFVINFLTWLGSSFIQEPLVPVASAGFDVHTLTSYDSQSSFADSITSYSPRRDYGSSSSLPTNQEAPQNSPVTLYFLFPPQTKNKQTKNKIKKSCNFMLEFHIFIAAFCNHAIIWPNP